MFHLLLAYVKKHRWLYLLIAICLITYDISLILPTQLIQRFMDDLAQGTLTTSRLWLWVGGLVLANVLSYVTAYIWNYNLFKQAIHFRVDLQQRAFRKLVVMRTPFYDKFRSGDMLTRFTTDVELLQDMIGYGLMIVLYSGGMLLFIIPTMLVMSVPITLFATLPVWLLSIGIYWVTKKTDELVETNREAVANLNNEVLESVEGIRVMRAYRKSALEKGRFHDKVADLVKREDQLTAYRAAYNPLYSLMFGLSSVITLFLGAKAVAHGQMTVGEVLALQLYIVSLVEPIAMLTDFILVYQSGKVSFEKLTELIETSDDMEADGTVTLTTIDSLSLSAYRFTYPRSDRPILTDISFTLEKGQTLGIVGKTGSGKTTLVRQLLRQYPLGTGEFLLNGRPITDYRRQTVEECIGYVPQEHILFSKSIRENIAVGKSQATEAEIAEAIQLAAFTNDVKRMPQGLETSIGERGVSISGGQKQRIAIARSVLNQPDLLILDDALSAVDAKTEREIIDNIQHNRAGKTTIIVTHRLSALQAADWVLVMEDGRIVEAGPPQTLQASGGWYAEQYERQQAKGEISDDNDY